MNRRSVGVAVCVVVTPVLVGIPVGPAAATFQSTAAVDLASAISAAPGTVTGASYSAAPADSTVLASSGNLATDVAFVGFPRQGASFAVLSTGRANALLTNVDDGFGYNHASSAPSHGSKAFDVTELKVDVAVPAGSNCAAVDLRYLTDETTATASIQDHFVMELDATSWTADTAVVTTGAVAAISQFSSGVAAPVPTGGLVRSAATDVLTASVPISTGAHSLYFSVFDHVDHLGDSDVLLDNLRFTSVADPATGCATGLATAITTTSLPTVTGIPRVGSTLTATSGSWTPASGLTFARQWLRNGVAIPGATSASYVPGPADVGKQLRVRVTASNGSSVAADSAATTAVAPGSLTSAKPTISGRAKVGKKLTARTGTWSPGPVTFAYQWFRGTKALKRARAATYKLVAKDAGKKLHVVVTGTKPGYGTVARPSASTKKVQEA